MNINSYNVTDVAYHYIGLRVLAGLPSTARRDVQTSTIATQIRKYVSDRALRLMLPDPKGTFDTAGEKVCSELLHFNFVRSVPGAYELTDAGQTVVSLLNNREYRDLRQLMAKTHLRTYDNLRFVVSTHLDTSAVWRPVVDGARLNDPGYIACLLAPTYGDSAEAEAFDLLGLVTDTTTKKAEDILRAHVLKKAVSEHKIGVSMFRAMCDRLISLRLLNQMRDDFDGCEFLKTYTPCVAETPPHDWYVPLEVELPSGDIFDISFCDPDMSNSSVLCNLLQKIYDSFAMSDSKAGYYDLPEIRDQVCEQLKIPEAAFDEGLNNILDSEPRPFTLGLQYDRITGRRKPLLRNRGATQIYNLIRRA